MPVECFAQKTEDQSGVSSVLSRILEKNWILHENHAIQKNDVSYSFLRTKVQMPTPFLRDRP